MRAAGPVLYIARADTFWKRFCGLMFRGELGEDEGLLISGCNAIHTFCMRFPIDAIFLDHGMRVKRLCEGLRPNRLGVICRGAASVLECRAGFIARAGVAPGHVLELSLESGDARGVAGRFSLAD